LRNTCAGKSPFFGLTNTLRVLPGEMDTLLIGMTADMDGAIQAGSTMVRVGTANFGLRFG